MSLDDCWEKVREFQEAFGHPVASIPRLLDQERAEARYKWMLEELEEFLRAKAIYEQADAMIDLIYFALGTLVEIGAKPGTLFDIVHEANMRKMWPDRKPRFNESGKTIKPSGWIGPEPELRAALDKQIGSEDCL